MSEGHLANFTFISELAGLEIRYQGESLEDKQSPVWHWWWTVSGTPNHFGGGSPPILWCGDGRRSTWSGGSTAGKHTH